MTLEQILNKIQSEAQLIRGENPEIIYQKVSGEGVSSQIDAYFSGKKITQTVNQAHSFSSLELQPAFVQRLDKSYDINSLLGFHGERFIAVAFAAMLGREADNVGRGHFTNLLLSGVDKSEILARLALSKEGRQYSANISGLAKAKIKTILYRVPVLGYIVRWCFAFVALPKLQQRANLIEAHWTNQDQRIANHVNAYIAHGKQ